MGLVAILVVLTTAVYPQPRASAAGCGNFAGVAAADGVRMAISSPGYLLVERADAAAPSTQARLDSVAESTGFASDPSPGEVGLSGLALARNSVAAVPEYPLVAQSSYPTHPEADVEQPGLRLQSTSADRSSSADAQRGIVTDSGPSSALSSASSSVSCADDGTVTAWAESRSEGLSFGNGVLRIASVHSSVQVVRLPDGQVQVDSNLRVDGATVLGQAVAVTEEGLVAGETTSPLLDTSFTTALNDAGIAVSYLAGSAQADGNGVVAPTLRIEFGRQIVGSGPTVTALTFGRAYAGLSGSPSRPRPASTVATTPPADPPTAPAASAPPIENGAVPVAQAPSRQSSAALAAPAGVPAAVSAPLHPVSWLVSSWSFYPVLVLAAALLLGSSMLVRKLGVKLAWI